MELSRYNIIKTIGEDTWVFNAYSMAFIKINTDEWLRAIENIRRGNSPNVEALISAGIVVDSSDKQLLMYKYMVYNHMFKKADNFFYIAPTMRCNMKCYYCFEGNNKTGEPMSDETISQFVDFLVLSRINQINIVWFGGEPLLEYNTILKICDRLQSNDIEYRSSIITNGTLLTSTKLKTISKLNLDFIQISIDGVGECHNNRRMFKNGSPSFDLIMNNIKNILLTTNIPIMVQVTEDKQNSMAYTKVKEYLDGRFPEACKSGKIQVNKNYVQNRTGFDSEGSCYTHKDIQSDIIDRIKSPSYGKGISLPSWNLPCMFRTKGSFAIGPNGDIFKCIEHLGIPENRVGSIKTQNLYLSKLCDCSLNYDPFSDSKCMACEILPICGGGCPIDRRKMASGDVSSCCSSYKDTLADILPYIYEYQYKDRK